MCGIVGYVGSQNAARVILDGLDLLDYRGYDSAGLALVQHNDGLQVIKVADPPRSGRLGGQGVAKVRFRVEEQELIGHSGIGHTRWATHGPKTDQNAHPHLDCGGRIAVVHNGQISNYQAIKKFFLAGHTMRSETDTEVIPHLIESFLVQGDSLITAVQRTAKLLEGAFTFVALDGQQPDQVIGVCQGGPLIIGVADHGLFLASDVDAFARHTEEKIEIKNGEMAVIQRDGRHHVLSFDNDTIARSVETFRAELDQLERGVFPTFMAKEIFDQTEVVHRVLDGRLSDDGTIRLGGIDREPEFQHFVQQEMKERGEVVVLGCGTSLYAGYAIVRFLHELGFSAQAIDAAEFSHSSMPLHPGMLVIPISQSGETKDLLEAMDKVRAARLVSFALCNKPNTQLTRYGTGMHLQAGKEKAVASTKAFTAQVLSGGLLGLALAQLQGRANIRWVAEFETAAKCLSKTIERMLSEAQAYEELGWQLANIQRMFYIGRGYNRAIALEGALKMMEIAEMDAHGMSAAAMKHGPLALVHKDMVVVGVCLPDPNDSSIYEATLDNLHQVLSNEGQVIAVIAEDDQRIPELAAQPEYRPQFRAIIRVPVVKHGLLSTVAVVPLQLMALGAAQARQLDPDRPRGLAKSVTVR